MVPRDTLKVGEVKLDHNTIYSHSFNKKVQPRNVLFTPLENLAVTHGIKFRGKSHSKDKYRNNQIKQDINQINFAKERDKLFKPPLGVEVPLFADTNYRTHHQKFFV